MLYMNHVYFCIVGMLVISSIPEGNTDGYDLFVINQLCLWPRKPISANDSSNFRLDHLSLSFWLPS